MLPVEKKYLYAGLLFFSASIMAVLAHSSVISDSGSEVSLHGEKFYGDIQTIRQVIRSSFDPESDMPKIGPRLKKLIREQKSAAKKGKRQTEVQERVRVVLAIAGDNDNVARVLQESGAKRLARRGKFNVVEMPLQAVEKLVNALDEVEYARLPHRFRSLSVTSEGIGLTGALKFHDRGYRGSGVKVAVLDVGFKGLTAAQNSGDIPDDITVIDFTGRGLQTEYLHGTACAEIVHDMAPQAELYLLKISDEGHLYNALDYCAVNGIDIISYSLGTFGSGPGNGTGPIDEAFDEARAKGILVVAAAGNGADANHWQGSFIDSNSDDIHEFHPGDQEGWYNGIAAAPYRDDDGNPATSDVSVVMRWNNWPSATIDYDMYLLDYDTGQVVAASEAFQNGSQPPLEQISINLPDSENYWHVYALVVTKVGGEPAGTDVEISLGGTARFVAYADYAITHTPASSISEPADARSVFAVGAINYSRWASGPQEPFSSQGPTNAWAGVSSYTKPDICGPDGTSGTTYGSSSFLGTSAATPHVAGAAALVLSMSPDLGPDELQSFLEDGAVDMGRQGKDNIYGWGRLYIEPVFRGLPWLFPLLNDK